MLFFGPLSITRLSKTQSFAAEWEDVSIVRRIALPNKRLASPGAWHQTGMDGRVTPMLSDEPPEWRDRRDQLRRRSSVETTAGSVCWLRCTP